jgi:bacteriocin-like protein
MPAMKKRKTSGRSPRKLAIHKDKLQVLSQDELQNVNGGGDPPGGPHKADGSAYDY